MSKRCPNCGYEEPKKEYEGFDAFWNLYPRKTGKGLARSIWNRLKPDAMLYSTIIVALQEQIKNPTWIENGVAIYPHPATWLRQERWLDEVKKKGVPQFDAEKAAEREKQLEDMRTKELERLDRMRQGAV